MAAVEPGSREPAPIKARTAEAPGNRKQVRFKPRRKAAGPQSGRLLQPVRSSCRAGRSFQQAITSLVEAS
jgi:hypothetical protein